MEGDKNREETVFSSANDEFLLEKIKGIGVNTMKKLERLGITSAEQLKERNPDELTNDLPGITGKKVEEWIIQIPV